MAISIATNVTGTLDQSDRRAMEAQIDAENARRATLTPPGTPLTYDTAANRKAGYEQILNARLLEVHASYVAQAKEAVPKVVQVRKVLPDLDDAVLNQIAAIPAVQAAIS